VAQDFPLAHLLLIVAVIVVLVGLTRLTGPAAATMALAWFTVRAAGTILGPFAILTAFMAFAPRFLGAHEVLIFVMSIGVGFAACYPHRWSVTAGLLRYAYVYGMLTALAWWTLFAASIYFPAAWMSLGLGRRVAL